MNHDEQTIFFFALRYSLGRKTYAFGLVTDAIIGRYKEFYGWALKQMADEIRAHLDMIDAARPGYGLEAWEVDEYNRTADRLEELSKEVIDIERRKADADQPDRLQQDSTTEAGRRDVSPTALPKIRKRKQRRTAS